MMRAKKRMPVALRTIGRDAGRVGVRPARSDPSIPGAYETTVLLLREWRLEPECPADGLVPLLDAVGAAASGPAREHGALDELLMCLGVIRLHGHNGDLRELAEGARLLRAIAVVGFLYRLFKGGPHLVFVGLDLVFEKRPHL